MKFSEAQHAPRVMHWVMLGAAVFSFGFVVVTSVLLAISDNTGVTDEVLIPIALHATIFGLVWIMFWRSTLGVTIDDVGVHVRFYAVSSQTEVIRVDRYRTHHCPQGESVW